MEACAGAHHWARKFRAQGVHATLRTALSKTCVGHKNGLPAVMIEAVLETRSGRYRLTSSETAP